MPIVFFCQSCGSRFDLDERFAGKKGQCKHCGQRMQIPQASELTSMAALPRISPASEAAPVRAAADARGGGGGGWIANAPSSVALAPLTVNALPRGFKPSAAPDALADASDSALYALVETNRGLPVVGPQSRPAGPLVLFWRRRIGGLQNVVRWLYESAYVISIPFIVVLLVGIAIKSRSVALLGATVVIGLNLLRLIAGVVNLSLAHFRQSVVKGVLFLIPPVTIYYLASEWKRSRKAVRRIIEPTVTIVLVVLAFLFIPWLKRGGESGTITERVRAKAEAFKEDVSSEVGKVKNLDVQQLEEKARGKLRGIEGKIRGGEDAATPTRDAAPSADVPKESIEQTVKDVADQIRKRANDAPKQP